MHFDMLGAELNIGDVVVTPKYNTLAVCKVIRFTPKMVKLGSLDSAGHYRPKSEFPKYASDIVKIDEQQALIYLLKLGGRK